MGSDKMPIPTTNSETRSPNAFDARHLRKNKKICIYKNDKESTHITKERHIVNETAVRKSTPK